ncbi:DNA repair protein RecO [Sphingomicrobium nitratireducens]|uniref:DNA repair protein RecO n=1 Tax=Sphingomicrobium nitratireducens TaxID=2964666 RepID=UPI002240DA51|nr:DNA repair protein RecO [Sphingomicrobium nitratireducens]
MRADYLALVVSTRAHGEHGAVVRLMTEEDGLLAAYVRGARGRRLGPVLVPGNLVGAALAARTETQLPHASVELVHSRGPLLSEPLPAAAIAWATSLVAAALPEGQAYPAVHGALVALLEAVEAAPSVSGWGAALVRFELLMLRELGFGLDLEACAVTGEADDLVAVSPKSGRAVSAGAAKPYRGQLLPLPSFLAQGGSAGLHDVLDGLRLSGHFLERDLLIDRAAKALDARARLVGLLERAAGER